MRIALIAGEASGDNLGGPLIEALRERFAHAEFAGIGGARMHTAGLDSWFDMQRLSVMGLVEVLKHLPSLLRLRHSLIQRLRAWQPDVVIGIDAPDFNLRVERALKAHGFKTVHYVSPSVWAWREQRARRMARNADLVLCLFPMEPAIYQGYGVKAQFVGHPAADKFPLNVDRRAARSALQLDPERPLLALLPGSRLSEIARLSPSFIEATRRFLDRYPDYQALAPMATPRCREAFARALGHEPRITLIDGQSERVLMAADLALLASGTAALEALLARTPMVVGYRIAALTHWLVTQFGVLKAQRFSLPNFLSDPDCVPEVMQGALNADNLLRELIGWVESPARQLEFATRAERVHLSLKADASSRAAAAIAELLR